MVSALVLYFSWSKNGTTRQAAKAYAKEHDAALCEVEYAKKPSTFSAFLMGCPAAMGGKPVDIKPIGAALGAYDRLVLMAPVWASNPAPPFNSMLELLPSGKEVEVVLTSGSGSSSEKAKERIRERVKDKGCSLVSIRDLKGEAGA